MAAELFVCGGYAEEDEPEAGRIYHHYHYADSARPHGYTTKGVDHLLQ